MRPLSTDIEETLGTGLQPPSRLERAYGYEKTVIINILRQLLVSPEITISSHSEAWAAFHYYENGNADFSDYFIA